MSRIPVDNDNPMHSLEILEKEDPQLKDVVKAIRPQMAMALTRKRDLQKMGIRSEVWQDYDSDTKQFKITVETNKMDLAFYKKKLEEGKA